MRRTLKGAIVAAIFLFIWHALVWMIPAHNAPVRELRDSRPVVDALELQADTLPGTYFLNKVGDSDVGEGLWGWMTIHRSEDFSIAPSILGSFWQQILIALALSWIVANVGNDFAHRMRGVAAAAIAAAVSGPITSWNWSWYSSSYAVVMTLDLLVGWMLAGLLLCWLIGPSETAERTRG